MTETEKNLELYGLSVGHIIHWEDADGNTHVGIALEAIAEDDGGHYLNLKNMQQGIDTIYPSMITSRTDPKTNEVIFGAP